MSANGMTLTVLATTLAQAVAKDEEPQADGMDGFDLSAGMFGKAVSQWLRETAAAIRDPKKAHEISGRTVDELWAETGRLYAELADMKAIAKRIAHELRTYNPAADEHKGLHIHSVWARELEMAINPTSKETP